MQAVAEHGQRRDLEGNADLAGKEGVGGREAERKAPFVSAVVAILGRRDRERMTKRERDMADRARDLGREARDHRETTPQEPSGFLFHLAPVCPTPSPQRRY